MILVMVKGDYVAISKVWKPRRYITSILTCGFGIKFTGVQNFVSAEKLVACIGMFFPAEPQAIYRGDIPDLKKLLPMTVQYIFIFSQIWHYF